jgi:membrane-associated phospholipid phosphatase
VLAESALVRVVLLMLGVVVLGAMAVAAHSMAYFPGDLAISHAVQAHPSSWLDTTLGAVSWTGFPPESNILFGLIVVALALFGSRWAALMQALAAVGSGGLYLLLQQMVGQARPSSELIRSAGQLQFSGFPSGHLATFTAVFGFLAYLGYRRFRQSDRGWLPIAVVGCFLGLMCLARIYSGQHWASDVVAGVLLGGLWLAVVIRVYCWGVARRTTSIRGIAEGYARGRSSV